MSSHGSGGLRVALIDADTGFAQVLAKRLESAGGQLRVIYGPVPPEELVAMRLGALVADPAVLGDGALGFLESVCEALPDLGIVVCTERSTVAQRVRGLRLGADDWVTKPCHPEEVVARIEAVVRRRKRAAGPPATEALVAGDLEIRGDQFQAFADGRSADLTLREFELLQLLADARGLVLQREEIYQRVWGYAMAHGDRSVDVFVRKLRQKLDRISPGWRYIHTHFGIGYRFQPEPTEAMVPDALVEEPAPARPRVVSSA